MIRSGFGGTANRAGVYLGKLAAATPANTKRALELAIVRVENEAKQTASSSGVFSSKSTGALRRSFSTAVHGGGTHLTVAVLYVGVKYGRIQDHGGVIKRRWIQPRPGNVTRGVSWIKPPRLARGDKRPPRRNTRYGGVLAWMGPDGKMRFSKGHFVGPTTIRATNYSWRAWLRAEPYAIGLVQRALRGELAA